MIIMKLQGGLGNQMFQFATGLALSQRCNTPLALDHSFLELRPDNATYTIRKYELSAFNIHMRIQPDRMPLLFHGKSGNLVDRILFYYERVRSALMKRKQLSYYFIENPGVFDNSFLYNGKTQYLDGYFQKEDYFSIVTNELREYFKFVPPESEENIHLIQEIEKMTTPVSVHVRRGDYLTIAGGTFHGVADFKYYVDAIEYMNGQVLNPFYYVFSADDPEWAREHFSQLSVNYRVVGEKNTGAYGYENMRMMSLCKHHIIANSSFSWWGAWLNPSLNKIVVAPKEWYTEEAMRNISPCPPQWHKISMRAL